MEMKDMIAEMTRELLQSMQAETKSKPEPDPQILFIFCDSTAHEPFADQFIQLQNAFIRYDMLFLDGETMAWLNMHRVESSGSGRVITADEYAPAPIELPKQYEGIVIPEIDLDNAARVVAGMKGSVKAEIIFSALVLGKFVLAGEDVPGIKRADRRCLKTLELPQPYRKLFLKHMEEMKMLGIQFFQQQHLASAVIDKCRRDQMSDRGRVKGHGVIEDKLVTAEWVCANTEQLSDGESTLSVSRHSLITPLARDLLHELGVAIRSAE